MGFPESGWYQESGCRP